MLENDKTVNESFDSAGSVYVIDALANTYFELHEWEQALIFFQRTIQGFANHGKPLNDNAIIEMSLKIVQCFEHLNKSPAIIDTGYCWCIDSARANLRTSIEKQITLTNNAETCVLIEALTPLLANENKDAIAMLGWSSDLYGDFLLKNKRYQV